MSEGGVLIPYDHSTPYNPHRYPVLLSGTDPGHPKRGHYTGGYHRANPDYSSVSNVSCVPDDRDTKFWPESLSSGAEVPIESQHDALPEDLHLVHDPLLNIYSCDAPERTVQGEITRINGFEQGATAPSSRAHKQVQKFQVNQTLTFFPGSLIPSGSPSEFCISRDSVS
jgi:hypothetical protein